MTLAQICSENKEIEARERLRWMREGGIKRPRGREESTGRMCFTARLAARLTSRIQQPQQQVLSFQSVYLIIYANTNRNLHFFVITWHLYKIWHFPSRVSELISGVHSLPLFFFSVSLSLPDKTHFPVMLLFWIIMSIFRQIWPDLTLWILKLIQWYDWVLNLKSIFDDILAQNVQVTFCTLG